MNGKRDRVVIPGEILLEEVSSLLQEGRSVVIRARGYSMSPFIRHEEDSVELIGAKNVRVDDIALARVRTGKGVRYVMHRVVSVSANCFTMMGDGNISGTETVKDEDLIGIVKYIIHPDGSRTDVHSGNQIRLARLWRRLLPFRRMLLAIWRRLPAKKS